MLFRLKFEVIEIQGGVTKTTLLNGWTKQVEKDIEAYKIGAKSWRRLGTNGMIVWR